MKKGGATMQNLIILRKSKKLLQTDLAKAIGVGANTISQYENGKRSPNIATLKKISSVLGCSVDDLIKSDK